MTIAEQLKAEGKEQGIQQGIQQGMQQVALNMIAEGMDQSLIKKVTGLKEEQIKFLLQSKKY